MLSKSASRAKNSGEQSRAFMVLVFKIKFLKNVIKALSGCPKSFNPDQARQNVGPDLGPNCLQSLPAEGKVATSRQICLETQFWSSCLVAA